jgi:hypothetical protein
VHPELLLLLSSNCSTQVVHNILVLASAGAEELQFVLVLRDYDHLLTAAAPETVVKTNLSQSLVGHRMAFQIRLRHGSHSAKLVSFADGKMLAMSVLAINLGPDEDMNEKVPVVLVPHSL